MSELVLSLFPGIGLLDRAFAAAVADRAGPANLIVSADAAVRFQASN